MKTINGTATSAVIFDTSNKDTGIDDYAIAQLQNLCDNAVFEGCRIRVMPDVHPGKVVTIGFTSTMGSRIMPNVVGADIGCGITLVRVKGKVKEFQKLDTVIRESVPSGFAVRKRPHHKADDYEFDAFRCARHIQKDKALLSLGTLGGGNHFIELDQDSEKNTYLVIHSGSRHLGQEVTEDYLREGNRILKDQGVNIPYELTYLDGQLMEDYLHDLKIAQAYAALNREIMVDEICSGMKWKVLEMFDCIHNYVDFSTDKPLIRKGAISAKHDEQVIIPINMSDGIILGKGLGNADWNYSAPHGAGRIMKREDVKNTYTVSQYKNAMKGIYSSCIGKETLDEAPFAYRGIDEIREAIKDTVEIDKIIKPIYNFKAGNE